MVTLRPGKDAAVKRLHPWIFSGAVAEIKGNPSDGDVVEIRSSTGSFLALGHFSPGSITVKIFSFVPARIDGNYWTERLTQAYRRRESLGLTQGMVSDAYRLVFTEGDLLPGLIIDWYNGVAVVQAESAGMRRILPQITAALRDVYGERVTAIYDKPGGAFLAGESGPVEIMETGHRFRVDFQAGQKTGFFLDQRANRMFAQFYARQRTVLNAFCYSGAFSVYALAGGATRVLSVDSSRQAVEWARQNVELNGFEPGVHGAEVADVKNFLVQTDSKFDMIILDPPAFAKTHRVTNNALHAYVHINAAAIRRLNPGGILFTFSCSQPLSRETFRAAVQSAAISAGRDLKILHHLSQGPDHPVSICHPEGEYLKGMILQAD